MIDWLRRSAWWVLVLLVVILPGLLVFTDPAMQP